MKMSIRFIGALVLGLAVAGSTYAAGFSNADVSRYWQKHTDAKKAIFTAFRTGAPVANFSQPFLDLTRWEAQLVMTGLVRGDDVRLVARLAKGDNFTLQSQYDYPLLAYRIFVHEFARLSGYKPDVRDAFDWATIKVVAQ